MDGCDEFVVWLTRLGLQDRQQREVGAGADGRPCHVCGRKRPNLRRNVQGRRRGDTRTFWVPMERPIISRQRSNHGRDQVIPCLYKNCPEKGTDCLYSRVQAGECDSFCLWMTIAPPQRDEGRADAPPRIPILSIRLHPKSRE